MKWKQKLTETKKPKKLQPPRHREKKPNSRFDQNRKALEISEPTKVKLTHIFGLNKKLMRSYFLNQSSTFAKFILNSSSFSLKTKIELCNQNKHKNYFFMNKLVQSLQSNAKFQKKLLKLSSNYLSGSMDSSKSFNESTEVIPEAKPMPKRIKRKSTNTFWHKGNLLRLLDFNFFLLLWN